MEGRGSRRVDERVGEKTRLVRPEEGEKGDRVKKGLEVMV